jgi:hypothetical protein
MTDGRLDVALMVYDSEEVHEAQLSGAGPCIHHWGIAVHDREASPSGSRSMAARYSQTGRLDHQVPRAGRNA